MPPLPVVTFVLGGWDLGTHADLILQGILFAQFTNYWSRYYKSDSLSLKLFVLGLCIATTIRSAQAIAFVWVQNVEYFADIKKASQMFNTNWVAQSTALIAAIIGFSVQAFFCRRLWIISNNIYVVAFVVLLFVFGLISAIVQTAFTFSGQLLRAVVSPTVGNYDEPTDKVIWSKIQLLLVSVWPQSCDIPGRIYYITVMAGDVILSGSTIYFLLKRSHQAIPGNVGILNRLLRIAFQSAAPVTLCALANVISGQIYTQHPSIGATVLFLELINMILPKVYATSAMWTLNSRKGLGADTKKSSEKPNSHQMATTILSERRSVDGGPTVLIERHEETEHDHIFERRIKPYPDDISRQLESIPEVVLEPDPKQATKPPSI
ncbi:hypothetical protein C8J57DRAFT_1214430 [Mycena rebaudengoi]|nr:hypothetical protein C8J57DRAFT_1214430 [Mycena rebaudengoi]